MRKKGGLLKITLTDEYIENKWDAHGNQIKQGNYLRLSVSDTGEGIPHENLIKIFEPYFTTKAPGEGTGMGLAVVHGIVKGYEGDITVESTLEKGTTFNIFLPLSDINIIEEKIPEKKLYYGSERILFIDDETDLIKPVMTMLEKLGYRVTSYRSSVNALKHFSKNSADFDLIITDQTMPELSGKDLAAKIKTIRTDIPIILCTGYSDQVNETTALSAGISAFVVKPMLISEISKTIREILDSKLNQ